jgi:phosphoenolpyruvate phosphomutase
MIHSKAQILRQLFQAKSIVRIVGAHNGLGAKLIEEAGFDGVWASGLEISTSFAVPDANILTMTENLAAAQAMNDATSLPIVCDCDTGFGNASNVIHMVKKFEAAGIAGVVIEDKIFPKVNSFIPGRQELAPIEEFMGKIEAAKEAQSSPDFMVFARVEALIAGWGRSLYVESTSIRCSSR